MKAILAVFICAVALAGCVKPGLVQPNTAVPVSKVQEYVLKACGFLPAAQTVVAISGYQNANLDTVNEISAAICASLRSRNPTVMGVRVQAQ